MKNQITRIKLNRGEGPTDQCGVVELSRMSQVYLVGWANRVLNEWRKTAPANGAYDKVDFEIDFENDYNYRGRFDMKRDEEADLLKHVCEFIEFTTGDHKPEHLTDEQYNDFLDRQPNIREESRDWLEQCDFETGRSSGRPVIA